MNSYTFMSGALDQFMPVAPTNTEQEPRQVGQCPNCRYDLRGLAEPRCPECGTQFDPTNPATMYFRGDPPRWLRFWLRPPGMLLIACAIVGSLSCVLAVTQPLTVLLMAAIGQTLLFLVALTWVLRLCIRGVLILRYGLGAANWRGLVRWTLPPALVLLTTLLVVWDVPLRLLFWTSKSQLQAMAMERIRSGRSSHEFANQWYGLYYVTEVYYYEKGVRISIAGWTDQEQGFAFHPGPGSPADGVRAYRSLAQKWYTFGGGVYGPMSSSRVRE